MSPEQCRAARALLGWSRSELAAKANCAANTVRNFELGLHALHINNLKAIRRAFEDEGVEFRLKARPKFKGQRLAPSPRPATGKRQQGHWKPVQKPASASARYKRLSLIFGRIPSPLNPLIGSYQSAI
jgi:transcriptional regulator with XRE-family HTH domain